MISVLTEKIFHSKIMDMIYCAIVINAFRKPINTVKQAERLKKELEELGVKADIISNGYLAVEGFKNYHFVIYLDKDKYLSKQIEMSGIRLFNSHDAIRICDDKGETYIALNGANIKIPKTIFAPLCYDEREVVDIKDAEIIIKELKLPVVVKESYGSMGKGVYKADSLDELYALMSKLKNKPHLYQEYLGKKKGEDIRVIVIGGKVVASMRRKNDNDFRSNIALGGKGEIIELKKDFSEIAEKASKALGLDYCGVDILYGNNGEPVICEVNSNAFFEEIENITGENIAKKYCEYILKCIEV